MERTRRIHATVLFSDGSHREVHTPSLDQRTDEAEWLAVRAALEITASEFAAAKDEFMAPSKRQVPQPMRVDRIDEALQWLGDRLGRA